MRAVAAAISPASKKKTCCRCCRPSKAFHARLSLSCTTQADNALQTVPVSSQRHEKWSDTTTPLELLCAMYQAAAFTSPLLLTVNPASRFCGLQTGAVFGNVPAGRKSPVAGKRNKSRRSLLSKVQRQLQRRTDDDFPTQEGARSATLPY